MTENSLYQVRALMQSLSYVLRLGPSPGSLNLPIELSRAWIHLVTFLTLVVAKARNRIIEAELNKCQHTLESGRRKLFQMRALRPLHEFEAVLPSGMLSLIVKKLVGSVTDGSPDIEDTYFAYVTQLVRFW